MLDKAYTPQHKPVRWGSWRDLCVVASAVLLLWTMST